ncbi:MAG TPA: hypothetical protein DCZ10_00085, partial [Pelotomaculum sp.]|nr:hypothetical protein [Pelotomaculum sp.]
TSIVHGRAEGQKESAGIWDVLEMAWQPFLVGAGFLPGAGLISRLNQTVNPKMRKPGGFSFGKSLWKFARRSLTRGDRP